METFLIGLAMLVASAVLTLLISKSPAQQQAQKPAELKDFGFPQIDEGTPQIVVFGDVWLTDWQVLWYGNLRSEGIPSQSAGGKK
jgi:hypothetical protein